MPYRSIYWLSRNYWSLGQQLGLYAVATFLCLSLLGLAFPDTVLAVYIIAWGWIAQFLGGFLPFTVVVSAVYAGLIAIVGIRRKMGRHRGNPSPFRRKSHLPSRVVTWLAASPVREIAYDLIRLVKWPIWFLFQIAALAGIYLWMYLAIAILLGTHRVLPLSEYWNLAFGALFIVATCTWFNRSVLAYPRACWVLLLRRTGYGFDRLLTQLSGPPLIIKLSRDDGEQPSVRLYWDL